MATITFFAPTIYCTTGALSTGQGLNANFAKILTNSAMGFGYLNSAWPSHILKDATARFANILDGVAEGDAKSFSLKHISVGNSDDAPDQYSVFYRTLDENGGGDIEGPVSINGSGWDAGRPYEWETNLLIFNHDTQVQIDDISVWVSSGSGGTEGFTYASAFILENSASGSQDWTISTPSLKMSFTTKSSASTVHVWGYGLSVVPHTEAVGFCDWGYLQISATYS